MADAHLQKSTGSSAQTYVIVPCVLLAGFLVFQLDWQKKRNIRDQILAAEAAAERAAAEELRLTRQREAADDARRRAEERDRREREREEAKQREFQATLGALDAQTATHSAEVEKLKRELDAADLQLGAFRANKEQAEREAFALAQDVARRRIDRRNAELELQRTTKMVLARLNESPWANSPRPAPPTTK